MNITIIDSPCGQGKTSYAIQMMRENHDRNYIYITPYLDEVKRIIDSCDNRYFRQPDEKLGQGSKLNHFNEMLFEGVNIASTHSLFSNINQETIDNMCMQNYTLILDETMNVLEEVKITQKDLQYLFEVKAIEVDEKTKKITWLDDEYDDNGKFADIKNSCKFGDLYLISGKVCYWIFPIEIFKYFKEVYILTYMHQGQIQTYYLQMHNIKYNIKSVEFDRVRGIGTLAMNEYKLIDYTKSDNSKYKDLINVYEGKLNAIENKTTDFSKTYFINDKKKNKEKINVLKKSLTNYFRNILKSKSNEILWTTFKDFKTLVKGKGYSKGFVECNIRATNEYRYKKNLAYCCNIYLNPMQKLLFEYNNINVNEEYFALDKLIQWIFRSQLRDNKEINIYIPSSRMRNLLFKWLENEM